MSVDIISIDQVTAAQPPGHEPGPPPVPAKKRGGGPRTPEGRDASKRNSLKHGLLAESVFPDELADAIARHTDLLKREFAPASPYEELLITRMARAGAK